MKKILLSVLLATMISFSSYADCNHKVKRPAINKEKKVALAKKEKKIKSFISGALSEKKSAKNKNNIVLKRQKEKFVPPPTAPAPTFVLRKETPRPVAKVTVKKEQLKETPRPVAKVTVKKEQLKETPRPVAKVTVKKEQLKAAVAPIKDIIVHSWPMVRRIKRNDFALNSSVGVLLNGKSYSLELEKIEGNASFGLLASSLSLEDQTGTLSGLFFGISGHYRLANSFFGRRGYHLGPVAAVGVSKLESSVHDRVPPYLTASIGLEQIISLNRTVHFYNKLSSLNIFHSESGVLNLGQEISLGVRIEF